MTLIKSISGIRGTIGGKPGEGLTPPDTVKFTAGFAAFIKERSQNKSPKIVMGRDARISGPVVEQLVSATLRSCGVHVVNLGLAATPTVEMAVTGENAQGGIILTASHNPKEWNALKLLNERGEFISGDDGKKVLEYADDPDLEYADVEDLGTLTENNDWTMRHIQSILDLELVNTEAVKKAGFKVAVDAVNSVGGTSIPMLLKELGVEVIELYCTPNGVFPHNPEPLPENLSELSRTVIKNKAHVGFSVDPDVDRLAIVCEDGEMFGEEYTLVSVADYILQHTPGNTVSNLSSTRALREVAAKHRVKYTASAVGEVNVVEKIKETHAVIGGEGNGGIIYPELHYGRDALVGIALFLSQMAVSGQSPSRLKSNYPKYVISKNKIELSPEMDVDNILKEIEKKYASYEVNTTDGVKVDFEDQWFHLRKSNTEPIIRIYTESESRTTAEKLADKVRQDIKELMK